ncbi:MAG: cellulase family glycosylhydrolase [Bacteroidota bacterium]|nr:cellulase family glycosylhydrolase [Bacteroidota bacterium]
MLAFSFPQIVFCQHSRFVKIKGTSFINSWGGNLYLKSVSLNYWLDPDLKLFQPAEKTNLKSLEDLTKEAMDSYPSKIFWHTFQDSFITKNDLIFIKGLQFNTVNVPFDCRMFAPGTYLGNTTPRGFELVNRLIRWSHEIGMYIILDMQVNNIQNKNQLENCLKAWQNIAKRYNNESLIAGFYVHPAPADSQQTDYARQVFYRKMIAAIRQFDKNHIIFINKKPEDSAKFYEKTFDSKLACIFQSDTCQETFKKFTAFREKFNTPVFLDISEGENYEWLEKTYIHAEKNQIGWNFQPYKRIDEYGCLLRVVPPANPELINEFSKGQTNLPDNLGKGGQNAEEMKKMLHQFLVNCRFIKCKPNTECIKALGLLRE